jgi:hypothetical protein
MDQVYYVYVHTDFDGLILYVGKGKGKRAWHMSSRDSAHRDWLNTIEHDPVEIVEEDLTEFEAFRLENSLLRSEEPRFNKIRNH